MPWDLYQSAPARFQDSNTWVFFVQLTAAIGWPHFKPIPALRTPCGRCTTLQVQGGANNSNLKSVYITKRIRASSQAFLSPVSSARVNSAPQRGSNGSPDVVKAKLGLLNCYSTKDQPGAIADYTTLPENLTPVCITLRYGAWIPISLSLV